LAFVSSIFFSLYVIPRKLSKADPLTFSLLTGLGFFISSLVVYVFMLLNGLKEPVSYELFWSVLAGMSWAFGFVSFVKSIDLIGLARSNQWKNLQGPIGVLFSLIILSEYVAANPFYALLAGLIIFLSALALNIVDGQHKAKINVKGVNLAMTSGLAFGIVTVINKHVTNEVGVYSQQVVWSLAIFLSIAIYLAYKRQLAAQLSKLDNRNTVLGLAAGILYLGASFFMLKAYEYIPASIGFTIIQLNAVWTIIVGIFVFKEISFKEFYKRILLGLTLSIVGVVVLAIAAN